jgi:hypothetical protein
MTKWFETLDLSLNLSVKLKIELKAEQAKEEDIGIFFLKTKIIRRGSPRRI